MATPLDGFHRAGLREEGLPVTRSLSIHADYRCRHSGACCTADWPIPLDERLRQPLALAQADDRLPRAIRVSEATTVLPQNDGACVFYDRSGTGLCTIQSTMGADAMPVSCRHFPRVALLDPRGVSITLSHYCPTAAGMLFRDDPPLAIVDNPAAFPADAEYEGFDARDVLPPLLRPGLLWDLEGYSVWEREAVALLAREEGTPERALAALRRGAEAIERWTPRGGDLSAHVRAVFAGLAAARRPPEARGVPHARVVTRYLAAKLFASWVPYRADRLTSLIDALDHAHALLIGEMSRRLADRAQLSRDALLESIRATDFRIVHGTSA